MKIWKLQRPGDDLPFDVEFPLSKCYNTNLLKTELNKTSSKRWNPIFLRLSS